MDSTAAALALTGIGPGPAPLSRLGDPAVIADPYPLLAKMREASPFAEFGGALVVFGKYADCSRILRDPRASSRRNRSLLARFRPDQASRTRSFLSLDAPDHTRLRRLVNKAFTPRVVAGLAGQITRITDELLTAVGEAGNLRPGGMGAKRCATQRRDDLSERVARLSSRIQSAKTSGVIL